jgi:hypothetical protein
MGRILKALHKHAKEKQQGDPHRNLILTDWQLLCQYDPNAQKPIGLDNDDHNANPNFRRLFEKHLVLPDGKITQRGLTERENFTNDKKGLFEKSDVRSDKPNGLVNYDLNPSKAPNKNQSSQYRNSLPTPDANLTRHFFSQDMRNILPKIIDLRLIRIIFNTKFLLQPQKYIKLKSAEKIEYERKRYYIICLETEIIISVLLNRSGNFIKFTHKNSSLTSSPSNRIPESHIVNSQKMVEIQSIFFNCIVGSLDHGQFAKLFYNVFQLQLKNIVNCHKGDFIIIRDQICYQTFLNAVISFSLIIDDDGNYIEMCSDKNEMIPDGYLIELLKLQDPICKIDLRRYS